MICEAIVTLGDLLASSTPSVPHSSYDKPDS